MLKSRFWRKLKKIFLVDLCIKITVITIEEKWDVIDYDFYHDQHTRLVFAKSKHCNWNYVFLGVYKPVAYREEKLPNGKTQRVKYLKEFQMNMV